MVRKKMKEISRRQAIKENLNFINVIVETNLSRTILMIERLKENPKIGYYTLELAIIKEETNNGHIVVSFWGEK